MLILTTTFTRRQEIVGKYLVEAFPDNPDTPQANFVTNLRTSLQKVQETRKPHQMALQRYNVPIPLSSGGGFEEKH